MSKEIAIKFSNVNQIYPLFTTPGEIFTEFLGLNKLFGKESKVNTFQALKDINLTINKGKRIGIIGQNGAGKTTLLKLATGNYFPTSGKVEIYGKVQSLMDSGLGFHQEFTGRENIKSSLIYNGLTPKQMKESIEDIIEFAELGEFIDQPIKTYSLGMLSRLGFATATAIYPEILIIDEIMGAGDAYFAAKSAERMKKLTHDGTTLLLVSHSTSQIIQFCTEVIWMKDGNIHMQGEALEVCKSYTKYMRERDEARLEKENSGLKSKAFLKRNQVDKTLLPSLSNEKECNKSSSSTITEGVVQELEIVHDDCRVDYSSEAEYVKSSVVGNQLDKTLLSFSSKEKEENATSNGAVIEGVVQELERTRNERETYTPGQQGRSVLRWNGSGEIRIEDFYMVNSEEEKCFTFYSKESINFIMIVEGQEEGFYPCKYVIVTYTLAGQPVTVHVYDTEHFFKKGEKKTICLTYPELLLGNGEYVVSLAVYKQLDLDDSSTALFYDLLDRSFQFKVINQYKQDATTFIHPAKWLIKQ